MTTRDLSLGFRVSDEFLAEVADPLATEVAINIQLTAELATSRSESRLAPFGLSRGGFNVLRVLAGADAPITPSEIAERVVARAATVTGLVDTLVRGNLAKRWPDTEDRRRVLVAITDEGRKLMERASAAVIADDAVVMACFNDAERERLTRLLGKLQNQFRDLNDAKK